MKEKILKLFKDFGGSYVFDYNQLNLSVSYYIIKYNITEEKFNENKKKLEKNYSESILRRVLDKSSIKALLFPPYTVYLMVNESHHTRKGIEGYLDVFSAIVWALFIIFMITGGASTIALVLYLLYCLYSSYTLRQTMKTNMTLMFLNVLATGDELGKNKI